MWPIEAAVRRRRAFDGAVLAGTDVYRLVDDAADDCEGVVVDRFGSVARIELRASQWPRDIEHVARVVTEVPGVVHVVGLLRPAGGKSELRVLVGDPPAQHVVHEDGMRFLVRTIDKDAAGVGVFVDQRVGRAIVRSASAGKVVMNLFAHAGAFGVAAVAGGAARVDHVDAARKCAPWAALNLALNGEDPKKHRFLVDDALAIVARAAKKDPAYDVIICDPPTTAVRPDGTRFHVEEHLVDLARDCLRALRPAGVLLLSSNNRALSVTDVEAVARRAAIDASRHLVSVEELPLPLDVPSAVDAALRPMRGVLVKLR